MLLTLNKLKRRFALLLLFLPLTTPVFCYGESSSCSYKDFRNEALGEVRDQDSVGWCFAFAAADLLTYKLNKKISAADLAVNNYHVDKQDLDFPLQFRERPEQNMTGGHEAEAIQRLRDTGGACLEENFKSDDIGFGNLHDVLAYANTGKRKKMSNMCLMASQNIFPHLETSHIKTAMQEYISAEYIKLLSNDACAPRIDIHSFKVVSTKNRGIHNPENIFKEIDEQFDKNNIVSLGYRSSLLRNKEDVDRATGHASTLVGRRMNEQTGQCEYLVRNSHGRSCKGYDPSFACEEGNIWVPKSILQKGTFDVTYILN